MEILKYFEYEDVPFAVSKYPRKTFRVLADGSFSKALPVERASHVKARSRTISREKAILLADALERA